MSSQEQINLLYPDAYKSLMFICGAKFSEKLLNIDTKTKLSIVRSEILNDYSFNSYDLEGINHLNIVLKYLRCVYLSLHSA